MTSLEVIRTLPIIFFRSEVSSLARYTALLLTKRTFQYLFLFSHKCTYIL
jgi:hypothetical protein